MLLLAQNRDAEALVARVARASPRLASRLFGLQVPRTVFLPECYDVVLDANAAMLVARGELHAPLDLQATAGTESPLVQRHILFPNLAAGNVTAWFARCSPRVVNAKFEVLANAGRDLVRACALHFALKEWVRTSLPLASLIGARAAAGTAFAALDRARVEMTAWFILASDSDLFGPLADLAATVALAHAVRSAAAVSVERSACSEGVAWLGVLASSCALTVSRDSLAIDVPRALDAVRNALSTVYDQASDAVANTATSADQKQSLARFAESYLAHWARSAAATASPRLERNLATLNHASMSAT
jgi:hypothetical protein